MYPGRPRVGRGRWIEHKKLLPPRVVLRRAPRMYVVYTAQALPIPARLQAEQALWGIERTPRDLPNEPKMALWGCLQGGRCAAQCLASSFAMVPALEVERVLWPAGAVRGVEWPSQTARLCISCPLQGGGFMQPRIWTRNRVQIRRFEMGGKGGARAHTIS
jgi:hypothetical protein